MPDQFQESLINTLENGTLERKIAVMSRVPISIANSIPLFIDILEIQHYYQEHRN